MTVNLICFVPREEMVRQAEDAARQILQLHGVSAHLLSVQAIETSQAPEKARQAVEQGADILIARGVQASLIKRAVTVPVVEISLTGQEMASLILQAKSLLPAERPKIAVVGFANMFCDMSSFDALYGVFLSSYFVEDPSQLAGAAARARADGAQLLIGGDAVCREAMRLGLPHLFLASGRESIEEAFRVAEKVAYASDLEKRNTAQFRALLDNTHNGVLRISGDGRITHANHPAERLLGKSERELEGVPLQKQFPDLPQEQIDQVLQKGEELFSTVLAAGTTALAASMMPVLVEGRPDGAILSFHDSRRLEEMENQLRRELYRRGQSAGPRFEQLVAVSPAYHKALRLARDAAALPAPVLLLGETGTGRETIARCIHGSVSAEPFAAVPCGCIDPLEQCEAIFGIETMEGRIVSKGWAGAAEGGVLYLEKVGALCPEAQYRLERLLTQGVLLRGRESRPFPARLRVIASEDREPAELTGSGILRPGLYYALCALTVRVPPLRERKEDILPLVRRFLELYQNRFSRFIRLTRGAERWLENREWTGNLPELEACCRKLVLTTPRRIVDEIFLKECMEEISPICPPYHAGAERVVLKDPRAEELEQALRSCGGNRTLAAQMLHINPSTLWRRMKKWGISGEEFKIGGSVK